MNLTSYYNRNSLFDNFVKNKLNNVFKKHNLTLW